MATVFPIYPASNLDQGTELIIFSSNQMAEVINGSALSTVETVSGNIPTLRKALVDNFFFKTPIPWVEGVSETIFNQLRYFGNGVLSGYYYAPTATSLNPIPMGSSPANDNNWKLFAMRVDQVPTTVTPWIYENATGYETEIAPPFIFDSAILIINGITKTPGKDFTIVDSKIILTEPLGLDPYTGEPLEVLVYIGKVTASDVANFSDQNSRITALETQVADLIAQVNQLQNP